MTRSPFDERIDIDTILTSVGVGTPSSAFPTPALGFSPGSAMDTSPALHDVDCDDLPFAMPLFGAEFPQQSCADIKDTSAASALGLNIFEGLVTIANTPQLGVIPIPPSPLSAPSTLSLPSSIAITSSAPVAPPLPSAPSTPMVLSSNPHPPKRRVTGHRRNITPANLVPVDAPTQLRSYVTPSATSRKAIPAAFQVHSKKRPSSVAFGDEDDLDPALEDAIETKRRQNTVAARRSRARKLEHVRNLENTVERLKNDLSEALQRAEHAEERVRQLGGSI
ncbi:uncharacterized protein EI90DRAFT_3091049 [Cantharellus anzutake]|uniref:uncharacterized protein n=1 Tax=Cantharellus anzutake TaxID=1750568 RepID=UPI001904AA0E|nr:uncharacterized protein EI90DRAFT_3091049 [Cantharellus anzutake]KAF8313950.1 hypothetical protein EI90DRAFT_3091049 [Cantharellus anzutake]